MLCFDRQISLFEDELVVDSLSPNTNSHRIPAATEPCLPAEMQSESARLQSFATWPVSGAKKLARYGFYASTGNDYITCAFCGLEISGFSSWREVKTWHWQVSGKDCPLLKEQGEETVPKLVYSSYKERVGSVNTNYRTEHLQLLKSSFPEYRENCSGMVTPSSGKASRCSRLMKDSGEASRQLGGCFAASESRVPESAREKLGRHQDLARSVTSSSTTFSCSPPKSALSSSTPRHATRSNVNVSSSTRSACISSATLISTLPPSTLPPSAPSSSTPSSSSSSPPQRVAAAAAAAGSGGLMPWRDLVRTAQIPHMVAYQARLESFSSWPLLSPTPRDLARAGLFRNIRSSPSFSSSSSSSLSPPLLPSRSCPSSSLSSPVPSRSCLPSPSSHPPSTVRPGPTESFPPASTFQSFPSSEKDSSQLAASSRVSGGDSRISGRPQDSVQCFWCGVHIHRWQPSDDPVLEHARLSPDCRYVIQLLGHQLHRDVITAAAAAAGSVTGSVGVSSRKDR